MADEWRSRLPAAKGARLQPIRPAPTPAAATDASAAERPLLEYLTSLGLHHTVYRHPPVMTVEEAQEKGGFQPGLHVKNMFLKAKNKSQKARRWVVTVPDDAKVDLKALGKQLGAKGGVSFAKDLQEILGIAPGAVTPFAVFNDREAQRVTSVLASSIVDGSHELVNAHPLHNEATVGLAPPDLLTFLRSVGHEPVVLDLGGSPAAAAAAAAPPAPAAAAAAAAPSTAWIVPSPEQLRLTPEALAPQIAQRYLAAMGSRLGPEDRVVAAELTSEATLQAVSERLLGPLRTAQNRGYANARTMFAQ